MPRKNPKLQAVHARNIAPVQIQLWLQQNRNPFPSQMNPPKNRNKKEKRGVFVCVHLQATKNSSPDFLKLEKKKKKKKPPKHKKRYLIPYLNSDHENLAHTPKSYKIAHNKQHLKRANLGQNFHQIPVTDYMTIRIHSLLRKNHSK